MKFLWKFTCCVFFGLLSMEMTAQEAMSQTHKPLLEVAMLKCETSYRKIEPDRMNLQGNGQFVRKVAYVNAPVLATWYRGPESFRRWVSLDSGRNLQFNIQHLVTNKVEGGAFGYDVTLLDRGEIVLTFLDHGSISDNWTANAFTVLSPSTMVSAIKTFSRPGVRYGDYFSKGFDPYNERHAELIDAIRVDCQYGLFEPEGGQPM